MAVIWTVNITVENADAHIVRIVAMRSDDSTTPPTTHVVALSADISTAQLKLDALDRLWVKWLAIKSREEAYETLIGTMEVNAKDNLEARET